MMSSLRRFGPLLLCLVAGFSTGLAPLLIWQHKIGKFIYLQSYDNVFYLTIAARSYCSHLSRVSDAVVRGGPTVYAWILFAPVVAIAHAFDIGPFGVNLIWGVLAATGIALSGYFAFLPCIKRRWIAAALTLIILVDCGVREGMPFLETARIYATSLSQNASSFFAANGFDLLSPWRVINPSIGLPFFLLNIGLVLRAVKKSGRSGTLWAGLSTGLLFYVYFYFWTPVLGALVIAAILDHGNRGTYAKIGVIGMLLGTPSLIAEHAASQRVSIEALQRMDLFISIPRMFYLSSAYGLSLLPKITVVVCILTGIWIWKREEQRDLLYPWSIAVAAVALVYNSVVTGKQLAPYHWGYAWGPASSFVVVVIAVREYLKRMSSTLQIVMAGVLCADLAASFYLRMGFALYSSNANEVLRGFAKYTEQHESMTGAPLISNSVIAGDQDFSELAAIGDCLNPLASRAVWGSASLSDDQVEERMALDARLEGINRPEFAARAAAQVQFYPPAIFDQRKGPALIQGLLRHYDVLGDSIASAAAEYDVRYVAIPIGRKDPDYLRNGWRQMTDGPNFRIWERRTATAPTPRACRDSQEPSLGIM